MKLSEKEVFSKSDGRTLGEGHAQIIVSSVKRVVSSENRTTKTVQRKTDYDY